MSVRNGTSRVQTLVERKNGAGNHSGGWSECNGASHSDANSSSSSNSKTYNYSGDVHFFPLLVLLSPGFAMVLAYTITQLDGQIVNLVSEVRRNGVTDLFTKAWLPYVFGSVLAWKHILPFCAFQLVLMRVLPGKLTKGPVTPAGNVPVYKANGLLSFFVTVAAFLVAAYLKVFNPADMYDHYLEFIGALNVASLFFCLALYLKGRFAPSSTDSGASGNFLFDYYWGTELYPRVFGWDVKQFTNCRFGLMAWPLLVMCFAWRQAQVEGELSDSMFVSVVLQLIYVAKFFHWEMGYMKTLDIMHDRAGFYLCWGCLVWVPSVYVSHTLYLTTHPNSLGLPLTAFFLLSGVAAIYINYNADNQKEHVRNTQGACTIWGRRPEVIRATYRTSGGEEKTSLLLVSGWWGVSRHFHYIPEIAAAFFWTVPALFGSLLAYFYFMFLTVLLIHRSVRDDNRCQEKYGSYWRQYREKVPYRIIPFVF